MTNQEILQARAAISQVPMNQIVELKKIYGTQWPSISSPTSFGKKFKKAFDNGMFPNLRWHNVKPDGPNHERYERIY